MTHELASRKPLRLWPGIAAAVLMAIVMFAMPAVAPKEIFGFDAALVRVLGGAVGAAIILLWWLFFSRAPWLERLVAVVLMVAAVFAVRPFTHVSIQNGMMARMFYVAAPQTLALAFVAWAALSRRLGPRLRFAALVVASLIGCGVWTLARMEGIRGGVADLAWRWTPTAEERLLAHEATNPVPAPAIPAPPAAAPGAPAPAASERTDATPSDKAAPEKTAAAAQPLAPDPAAVRLEVRWPGFRGRERDGVVRGVRIDTDWSTAPPAELWRRPVGPAWSSFAVAGDFIYTQEQRGDDELVSCYRFSTGEPVWRHADRARFWESNGGAGPRGTPTLHKGRVYTVGGTGIVNALDALTGRVAWSRDMAADASKKVPWWGFSSSPLIVDDMVIVAAAGKLVAYEIVTGKPRWFGPNGGGYSSPHLVTIDGVPQVLLMNGAGIASFRPSDGAKLWDHPWPGVPIVQPSTTPDGGLIVTTADAMGGLGVRRLQVSKGANGWTVEERWTSRGLKPYFNHFVLHDGHAYGFDGAILSCISLADGERKWKGGRYGNGQMVLLADQSLLLVVSEEGELALVNAAPDKFTEVARVPGIKGKTWNHPVVVGDVLLVRNGEEMAAFRLPPAPRRDTQPE